MFQEEKWFTEELQKEVQRLQEASSVADGGDQPEQVS